MNTITRTAILAFFPIILYSQVQIAGIINHYAKVHDIDPCEGKLILDNATFFTEGEQVMLIQMKGASINTANSSSFGNIEDLGCTGLYEINEVLSKVGNEVFLKYEFLNSYDPADALQLITIPQFQNVTVINTLTAQAWNGETGGVLVFKAENLNLSANIDVSGLGFRGATKKLVESECSFFTNADEYHYSSTNWRGSPKGEGIAALVEGKEHGRGAQCNGGGGGNDHNSGGGGGGNIVSGGIGGKQSVSGFGCDGDYPGRGGKACPNEQERIYLGGGGGAGHFDDNGAGSSGANGGGIVLIMANTIEGNGYTVVSNGQTPPVANGDGAGGGGAGGTIQIKANELIGTINIEAKGGAGGSVNNTTDRCNGAGGGGSGGRFISNLVGSVGSNLVGGVPGINTVSSGQCNGPSNGAEQGEFGIEQHSNFIPMAQQELHTGIDVLQQPSEAIGCVGVQLDLYFQVEGNYLNYQWQINTGTGWENVPNSNLYGGANSAYLTIFNPAPVMDGFLYRCLVSNPCQPELYSDEVGLDLVGLTESDFQIVPLGNGSYQFNNSSENAFSYLWDFGDGNTSDEENPLHSYVDFGNYVVTLTAYGPCGEDVFEFNLVVNTAPSAGFTFQNTGICVPQIVQFDNLSSANTTNFEWHFPGGSPLISSAESPNVTYSNGGLYDVMLIASNSVGADTFIMTQAIEVGDVPSVDFGVGISNLEVSFTNLSLDASLGYLWDFGDSNTSNEINPVHVFAAQGVYQVTLTAYNECGESTLTLPIPTGSLPLALFSANHKSGCNPFNVQFENQSSGSNLLGFLWEFPGGTPSISTEENPLVTYNEPGFYEVKLTVSNQFGTHTSEQLGFIQVFTTPVADFSYQTDGYTVDFDNATTNGSAFNWDFGDGTTSQAENPTHEYNGPGNYEVMLTTANMSCGSAIAYQIYLEPLATGEALATLTAVLVYPNPVSDLLSIIFKENNNLEGSIRLQNTAGQILQTFDFQGNNLVLSMKDYPSGVYFIVISTGETTLTKQVVKL